jgi:hypothetical protein
MLAVKQIDRAIKYLYNLNPEHCAEKFLIQSIPNLGLSKAASKDLKGALYISPSPPGPKLEEPSVDLGIYLSEDVRELLKNFTTWSPIWTHQQVQAFSIAGEEISHFHYFVFNLNRERPVSEFELELQGEIDKFLLLYFSGFQSEAPKTEKFEWLFEQLFFNFSLLSNLTIIEKQRYLDATVYARRFIQNIRKHLVEGGSIDRAITNAREFYQKELADKVGAL